MEFAGEENSTWAGSIARVPGLDQVEYEVLFVGGKGGVKCNGVLVGTRRDLDQMVNCESESESESEGKGAVKP